MAKDGNDNKGKSGEDGKNTPPADDKNKKSGEGNPADDKMPEEKTDDKKPEEKTYSAADLERAKEQAKKDYEKSLKDAEEKAKLSKEDQLAAELAATKRENQLLKAEGEMVKALADAGANAPELLFKSVKSDLEFDDAGKLTNLTILIDDLKKSYANQFGIEKPKDSIDGGKGNQEEPKGKPENLKEALKNYYKK